MPTVPVDNGHLSYDVAGTGRPVVLLHGGALDRRMWDDQIGALARDHQVIRVDARGHGTSSTPTTPFRQCDDVAALLLHLGIARATLVGLSMGGAAAVDTALEHPELVEALVVSGAGTSEPTFEDPFVLEQQQIQRDAARALDARAWVESFLRVCVVGPYRDVSDVDHTVVDRCRAMALHTVMTHATPDAVAPHAATRPWDRLGEIRVPVLTIVGALDASDHVRMVQRLAEGVQDARSVVVEGTAHMPNMERPDIFNEHVLTFLGGVAA